jgi:hypothetical protein
MRRFWLLSVLLPLWLASGCTTILRADFESDPIGSGPSADLPGFPSGDRLSLPNVRFSGSVSVIEARAVGEEERRELRIESRVDLSEPGRPRRIDEDFVAARFVSIPVSFPDRPIGTTIRGRIGANSGRLDMYFGDDQNCGALRLRLEDDRIIRLSPSYEPTGVLGELLGGFDFSITVFVDRSTDTGTLLTSGRALNLRETFALPSCVAASTWERNVLMLGFVSPAGRGSVIWLDVVEMSENTRGE